MTRHQLCHSVSIGPPSTEVDGRICLQNAVLGERPLNDKCPKIAKSQSTNNVGENNTAASVDTLRFPLSARCHVQNYQISCSSVFICVRTNVDCIVVASFITQFEDKNSIAEALQML